MQLLQKLESQGKIHPPSWLVNNTLYVTRVGSIAGGYDTPESDVDCYGYCVPTKRILFKMDQIQGFDKDIENFDQFLASHIDVDGKEHDLTIFNIVKYFRLVADANPNMIFSLFTPRTCVIHSTTISERVREKRKIFLSKKVYKTMKAYSASQLHKMSSREVTPDSKRMALREKYGFDTKYALNVVRLLLECEEILETGDLTTQKNSEILKSIRRGEWTETKVREWYSNYEKRVDKLYVESNAIPDVPDEKAIRQLLLECLEEFYGNLKDVIVDESENTKILREIKQLIGKANL